MPLACHRSVGGRLRLCMLKLLAWPRILAGRPGAMRHFARQQVMSCCAGRLASPCRQSGRADLSHNQDPSWGRDVRVKVERIRGGRRLPDVEYIETRAPRRPQTDKRERETFWAS